jgi:hypothetical protein
LAVNFSFRRAECWDDNIERCSGRLFPF